MKMKRALEHFSSDKRTYIWISWAPDGAKTIISLGNWADSAVKLLLFFEILRQWITMLLNFALLSLFICHKKLKQPKIWILFTFSTTQTLLFRLALVCSTKYSLKCFSENQLKCFLWLINSHFLPTFVMLWSWHSALLMCESEYRVIICDLTQIGSFAFLASSNPES